MGLDAGQVRDLVVRPTLEYLGLPGGIAAEKLVLGTAAQESKFTYLKQLGKGPALGLWQMEEPTFDDLMARMPSLLRDKVSAIVADAQFPGEPTTFFRDLSWNLRFACALCRAHYYLRRFKLNENASIEELAAIWKRQYNSSLGKGTPEQFLRSWKETGCAKLYPPTPAT